MPKGSEVAATAASTKTEQLAEPIPAVTMEIPLPTNTIVNATVTTTTANIASSNANTQDHSNNSSSSNNAKSNSSNCDKAGKNRSDTDPTSSPNNPATGDKIDTRPSEEWSEQFRDRRLMEDTFRRRALLRQLFSPDAESETEFPEDKYGTGAGEGGKRSGGGFRKKSGQGEKAQTNPSDRAMVVLVQVDC